MFHLSTHRISLVVAATLLLVPTSGCSSDEEECNDRACIEARNPRQPGQGDVGDGGDRPGVSGDETNVSASTTDSGERSTPSGDSSTDPVLSSEPDFDASCTAGEARCRGLDVMTCVGGTWTNLGPCAGGLTCMDGRCVSDVSCQPGVVQGCANDLDVLRCNPTGDGFDSERCDQGLLCWQGECQQLACRPGARRCASAVETEICSETGEAWIAGPVCDAAAGETCEGGVCEDPCDFFSKESTYIGCSYWAADLPMFADPTDFSRPDQRFAAVVLANLTNREAEVQVQSFGPVQPSQTMYTIPPRGTTTIQLPDQNISGSGRSMNSVYITTSQPVTAYQFKPLDNVGAASNDASLLIPETSLGIEHYVLTWPSGTDLSLLGDIIPGGGLSVDDGQFGYFTIIGTAEGITNVTITFSTDTLAGDNMPAFPARSVQRFEIMRGEVLNFESASEVELLGGFIPRATSRDFTGTRIVADQPISVFAGHKQAVLGEGGGPDGDQTCCADRLEQQLFPVETWGNDYLVVKAAPRGTEPDFFRVLAARDGTSITTNPPISGLNGRTLNAGQHIEISSAQSFELNATGPVLVGQFLTSQQTRGAGGIGDPTFILQVPRSQFRNEYLVAVPRNYNQNWLSIVKPGNAIIRVDNQPVAESTFNEIPGTGWKVGYVRVEAGAVRIDSDDVFGIYVTGYSGAVSYGYPGGLDFNRE